VTVEESGGVSAFSTVFASVFFIDRQRVVAIFAALVT
jgi:hypothetical protein